MALESESKKKKKVSECVVHRQILYYPQTIHEENVHYLLDELSITVISTVH